ncbi:hypothetical protein [Pseudomonas rubra]|uniref:Uncharacterized protein n=1 Tax=Pseudomonas rubra TaxID=2942627 RepID=A0ABT5PG15_9PSED|nr:hypothetical protein [Pseudomonas rubra]MDD1016894.1 hypothetical protein [Pseudomonas rubra]MDD1039360.1 hypothetical protein [Pseudomonas rubra]MDD1157858.1 hypothetical protein [Pseudomonas rubra]
MNKILSASLLGMLALFGASTNAFADTAMSWNLAKDTIMAKESSPAGFAWAFMQNSSGVNKAENYIALPNFKADTCSDLPVTCWQDLASQAHVSVHLKQYTYPLNGGFSIPAGNVAFHPGKNSQTIIRWSSPVSGAVNILGRVNSIHSSCGDGVAWSLNSGDTVLQSGSLDKGNGAVFSVSKVPVTKSSAIYLVLDKKANYSCDTSTIDMLITN